MPDRGEKACTGPCSPQLLSIRRRPTKATIERRDEEEKIGEGSNVFLSALEM